jgi:hypothetical protein
MTIIPQNKLGREIIAICSPLVQHYLLMAGARIIGVEVAKQMVDVFLASKPIVNEVTLKRLKQLKDLEDKTFL